MSVANKIKAAMNMAGKTTEELAKGIGIKKQSLLNKFYRDSFSASDLIKIAEYLGYDLVLQRNDKEKVYFSSEDISEPDTQA